MDKDSGNLSWVPELTWGKERTKSSDTHFHMDTHRHTYTHMCTHTCAHMCTHMHTKMYSFQSFIYFMYVHKAVFRHSRRASDPNTDGCEPPCGCWELNSEPLEEQSVLLTTEPSLQPLK